MNKKQITFFTNTLKGGGAEKNLLKFAIYFDQIGYSVDFLLFEKTGEYLSSVPKSINIVDLGINGKLFKYFNLLQYFKHEKPQVVISTLTVPNLLNVFIGKIFAPKCVRILRVSSILSASVKNKFTKLIKKILIRIYFKKADKIIALSKSMKQDLINYGKVPPALIEIIYNPTISISDEEKVNEVNPHTDLFKGKNIIIGVGRLSKTKDFETLILAFSLVPKSDDNILVILGEGEERENLQELINNLGLPEKVFLVGYQENPLSYMKNSSVFVLSSLYEGLPNVLIQALYCQIPIIVTNAPGGSAEILKGGEYGQIVPIGDVDELTNAIQIALSTQYQPVPGEWINQFSEDIVFPKILKLVESFLN